MKRPSASQVHQSDRKRALARGFRQRRRRMPPHMPRPPACDDQKICHTRWMQEPASRRSTYSSKSRKGEALPVLGSAGRLGIFQGCGWDQHRATNSARKQSKHSLSGFHVAESPQHRLNFRDLQSPVMQRTHAQPRPSNFREKPARIANAHRTRADEEALRLLTACGCMCCSSQHAE